MTEYMKKKLFTTFAILYIGFAIFVFVACILFILFSGMPARATRSWQDVNINGIASFKIPEEWNVEEHDGILFITDRPMKDGDYTIYIVGASHKIEIPLYALFEGVERGNLIRSQSFSRLIFIHGAILSLDEYTVNGVAQEHYTIRFDNSREGQWFGFRVFIWNNDVVNDWYAEQIARTFIWPRNYVDLSDPTFGRLEK